MGDHYPVTPAIEQVSQPTNEVRTLVDELQAILSAEYPPEQCHGFSVEQLFVPEVRFFVARLDGEPVGCGGVGLYDGFGEVKRMYVRPHVRGRGIGRAILMRIEEATRAAGLERLCIETGTRQFASHRLYEGAGFRPCGAFGPYADMPAEHLAGSAFYEKRV